MSVLLTLNGLRPDETTNSSIVVSWDYLEPGNFADVVLPQLCESEYQDTAAELLSYNESVIGSVLQCLQRPTQRSDRAVRELHEIAYYKWPKLFERIRVISLEKLCKKQAVNKLNLVIHTSVVEMKNLISSSECARYLAMSDCSAIRRHHVSMLRVSMAAVWQLLLSSAFLCISLFRVRWRRARESYPNLVFGYVEDPSIITQGGRSRFWGPLPNLLNDLSIPTTFVSIGRSHFPFTMSWDNRKMIRKAKLLKLKQEPSLTPIEVKGIHEFTTPGVIYAGVQELGKMLIDGCRLIWSFGKDYSPIPNHEWPRIVSSVLGPSRIRCAMFGNLFDKAISSSIKSVPRVLYLHEGQDWEVELLLSIEQSLDSKLNGRTVTGFVHIPLKNWDLRSCSPIFSEEYVTLLTSTIQDAEFLAALRREVSVYPVEPLRFMGALAKSDTTRARKSHNIVFIADSISARQSGADFLALRAELKKYLPMAQVSLRWHPNLPVPRKLSSIETALRFNQLTDLSPSTIVVCSNDTSVVEYLLVGAEVIRLVEPGAFSVGQHYLRTAIATSAIQAAEIVCGLVNGADRISTDETAARNCFKYSSRLDEWRSVLNVQT